VPLLALRLTDVDGSRVSFCWQPSNRTRFAVAAANSVLMCDVDALAAEAGLPTTVLDISLAAPPTSVVVLAGHTGASSCLTLRDSPGDR
jgi:hypothetical protein